MTTPETATNWPDIRAELPDTEITGNELTATIPETATNCPDILEASPLVEFAGRVPIVRLLPTFTTPETATNCPLIFTLLFILSSTKYTV